MTRIERRLLVNQAIIMQVMEACMPKELEGSIDMRSLVTARRATNQLLREEPSRPPANPAMDYGGGR